MYQTLHQKLQEQGIHPSRKLGQNFLTDKNWIKKTLEHSGISSDDRVIEIGPGLGALTRALLEKNAQVWAVELDHRIYDWLCRELSPHYPHSFHLMQGDAVDCPTANLPDAGESKVLANLPYAITSPWLDSLLRESGPLPRELHLILQKEAAERLVASPGTKEYGPMSIRLQLCYELKNWQSIPSGAFYPQPQVESRLVHWERKENTTQLHPKVLAFMKQTFLHRRKQIHKSVRKWLPEEVAEAWLLELEQKGHAPNVRAEEIPLDGWKYLHQKVASSL